MREMPLALRLPAEIVARLDALQEPLAADAETAMLLGGVSRSAAIRLAIVEGLRVVEARYGLRKAQARTPTAPPPPQPPASTAAAPTTLSATARALTETQRETLYRLRAQPLHIRAARAPVGHDGILAADAKRMIDARLAERGFTDAADRRRLHISPLGLRVLAELKAAAEAGRDDVVRCSNV